MTEKRFIATDDGLDLMIIDTVTKDTLVDAESVVDVLNDYEKENEELKKQIHLIHMASMFSTVKSFKGDVSKRYKYSDETDTIYDTANHYGQYSKVLDKKEITMLLNEYETVIKESEE